MRAKIYKQLPPTSIGLERDGKTNVFAANLFFVGSAEGSTADVWKFAKKLALNPVLEIVRQ